MNIQTKWMTENITRNGSAHNALSLFSVLKREDKTTKSTHPKTTQTTDPPQNRPILFYIENPNLYGIDYPCGCVPKTIKGGFE